MTIDPGLRTELYVALGRLEEALQAGELWEEERPSSTALASEQPFCYDTLYLHQWLQWRFIPRLRGILDSHGQLPESSAILPYAEECLREVRNDHEVLAALRRLDRLLTEPAAAAGDAPADHLGAATQSSSRKLRS
jgi:uncharacterized protein YqcC (DUF446 family)